MLSRRTSNLIFYGILLAILLVVVVARLVIVGSMNRKIDETDMSITSLQSRIENLEEAVQENKDTASDHLYELYDNVPEVFHQEELVYYTVAQLELLGITDEFDVKRTVNVNEEVEFTTLSSFYEIQEDFKVVEVYVHFEVIPDDIGLVDDFIDELYSSEQIFVVSEIQYQNQSISQLIGVDLKFLAFYKLEE